MKHFGSMRTKSGDYKGAICRRSVRRGALAIMSRMSGMIYRLVLMWGSMMVREREVVMTATLEEVFCRGCKT